VSIIRVGLSQTRKYSEGWDAIFGKGKGQKKAAKPAKVSAKKGKKGSKKARKAKKK
jgi:hypothetical protein